MQEKKTALVTGGSSGMGLEYTRQLLGQGYRVIVVSNSQEQLDALSDSEDITKRFQDLSTSGAAQELLDWCLDNTGLPDVLVCNAGMFFFKELKSEDLPRVKTMISLHVEFNTQASILFGNEMKKRGSGRIILMSSMAARLPAPGITIYSATKAYLKSFGKSLWFEMKPYGVKVTTICPAAIATPLYRLKPSLMKLGVRTGFIRTPRWLVRRALRASKHGRRVISPAFMNIYLPPLLKLLPGCIELKLWKKFSKEK